MQRRMHRRSFLRRGAGALSGLASALAGRVALAKPPARKPYYVLDPFWATPAEQGDTFCGGGCRACRACLLHADNKLCFSIEAALTHKAHAGCDCHAALGGMISQGAWARLFKNGRTPVRDRRDPEVQRILANS